MPNQPVRAAAIGLPLTSPQETAYGVTDAGCMYLLISAIVDRLHVEEGIASFELTPEMADELAAFGAEAEDMEDDDPAEDSDPREEDTPDEENRQLESDCRLEPYKPVQTKPVRRIKR